MCSGFYVRDGPNQTLSGRIGGEKRNFSFRSFVMLPSAGENTPSNVASLSPGWHLSYPGGQVSQCHLMMPSCHALSISLFKLLREWQAMRFGLICIVTLDTDKVSFIRLAFLRQFWKNVGMARFLLFRHHIQFTPLRPPVMLCLGSCKATWGQLKPVTWVTPGLCVSASCLRICLLASTIH